MNGWAIFTVFMLGAIASVIGGLRFFRWLFDGEYLP